MFAPELLRRARHDRGLTQAQLSQEAGVSLATVQNLEAGRANPAVSTLQRVLQVVGLTMEIRPAAPDWESLAAHGLPLMGAAARRRRPTSQGLRRHLLAALGALDDATLVTGDERGTGDERTREALHALLLALKHAYPTTYRRWLGRSPVARAVCDQPVTGRLIKLKRIAESRLADYL